MPGKYEPLELYLRAVSDKKNEITLSFTDVERIIGAKLPASAMAHQAWWGNQRDTRNRPQAHAWLSAGFRVDMVNQNGANASVRFIRRTKDSLQNP
ncbi:DUF7662 domain-containing protein [Candidatus Symbiobacter mobilis]|uniref:DUF7662 domain-containing protein n=1 Tax=Candidatus Symbiobacter mobilis CR TaxID=946483 RepID=U5N9S3_9BURK|nr:hypothetical protein Cenrod_2251 [Candidatus Symbiobacter mobilis CR]